MLQYPEMRNHQPNEEDIRNSIRGLKKRGIHVLLEGEEGPSPKKIAHKVSEKTMYMANYEFDGEGALVRLDFVKIR